MKINRLTRFPYPVLENDTNDYVTGDFSVGIEISESVKTGGLLIKHDVLLTEEEINKLVSKNIAKVCLYVTCLETYYNKLHKLSGLVGSFEIGKGLLSGNVTVLPLVVLTEDIENYSNNNFHEDYENLGFQLDEGSILAIGEDYLINVGREKLAPIETIFDLAVSDAVPPGQYSVNLDMEKITILAEKTTFDSIYNIRNSSPGKSIVLNSIYMPVLMEVLSVLQQDQGPYQDKRWFKIFQAKCVYENINIENTELLKDAQKLLKSPFKRVIQVMNEMD